MKPRPLLVLLLLTSLVVLPSLQLALAAPTKSSSSTAANTAWSSMSPDPKSPYSERVDIYTAGSNDYWQVRLNPVNASRPDILAAESVTGVTAYELTAIQASTASSNSPVFWKEGYGVVRLPFTPYSGVFLNVTATSQSAAQSAASDFSSLLAANFEQIGSSGNNYTFFSSADFRVAGATIFATVPTSEKGLAIMTNESSLAADPTPTAILTGVRSGSSFTHTVAFGSTEPNAVGTNGSLLLQAALNLQNKSLVSSPNATLTQVVVHSLDGLIKSSDNASITNSVANFSATYSTTVAPGTRLRPNITVIQNPPVLTVTRTVDSGSVNSGGLVTVTINLQNTALNGTIKNIVVNDSWWRSYPSLFSLSAGNSSFNVPSLAAGLNISRAYSLKVTSSTSEDLIAPASTVSYSYTAGNVTVNASTKANEVEVRTNNAGPALVMQAGVDLTSGSALGRVAHYVVTVTNTGNDPALSLSILNYTNPTLTPGGVWKIQPTISLAGIANRNFSQTFNLSWTSPDGTTEKLVSNPASVILSHSKMQLPLMEFRVVATTPPQGVAQGGANATWVLTNKGTAAASNVSVSQPFPSGVACKSVVSGNGTCDSSGFSLAVPSVASLGNVTGTLRLNFSSDNYLIGPASVSTNYFGLTLHTLGSALPVAAGVVVTKTFSPGAVFVGQNCSVTVRVTNHGSLPVYNVTLATTADSFSTAVSGTLHSQYARLDPNASQSLNYTVKMLSSGNFTSASTSLSYIFGGYGGQRPVSSGTVLVYKSLQATTSTTSTPEEGADFSLSVDVHNPSSANVTNVSVSIPLPQGLTIVNYSSEFQVVGRTVTLSVPSLAAGETSSHSLTLRANYDGSFNIGTGNMTFSYLGATLKGVVSTPAIVVGIGSPLRYELPIGVAVLITLAVAVYMHRKLVIEAK